MQIYEVICRFAEKISPLRKVAARKSNRELEQAAKFLSPSMTLSKTGVISAAYLLAILTFLSLLLFTRFLQFPLLISIPLTLLISTIVYFGTISYPINKMRSYRLTLSEESDIVFEQFVLVFQAGGTIFDAIEFVANSGHPFLSNTFRNMLAEINRGTPPEVCLSEFAKNQPSDDLRRYLTAIIASLERDTDLLDALSGQAFEADMRLRSMNLEMESRLMIVAALATYVPILFTLAFALAGLLTTLSVLLLVPFFVLLHIFTRTRFSRTYFAYFDRPQQPHNLTISQKDILCEYDEVLNMLLLISERLAMGDTLEVALISVREYVTPEAERLLDKAIETLYSPDGTLENALDKAASIAYGERVANLLRLTGKMAEFSAKDAGERLGQIITRLIQRSVLAKERESIIAAQKLKVNLLSLTSAIVLGLLSAIAPFLTVTTLFESGLNPFVTSPTLIELVPFVTTLLITVISTGYQNNLMVSGSRPWVFAMLCGSLYWLAFTFSASLLGLSYVF